MFSCKIYLNFCRYGRAAKKISSNSTTLQLCSHAYFKVNKIFSVSPIISVNSLVDTLKVVKFWQKATSKNKLNVFCAFGRVIAISRHYSLIRINRATIDCRRELEKIITLISDILYSLMIMRRL